MEDVLFHGQMKKVVIHSDGGCQGNPGPGGWAATLASGPHKKELSGGVLATTNNRMELQAAIEALNALKSPCEVDFYTDSEYVKNGVTKWIKGWKTFGWKTRAKEPVKNQDLWKALDAAISRHQVAWHWVKGHAGQAGNERCDELANLEMAKIRKQFTPEQLKKALALFKSQDEIGEGEEFELL